MHSEMRMRADRGGWRRQDIVDLARGMHGRGGRGFGRHGFGRRGEGEPGQERGEGRGEGRGRRRMFDGGELRLVVLLLIEAEPRHGYDIIREIELKATKHELNIKLDHKLPIKSKVKSVKI